MTFSHFDSAHSYQRRADTLLLCVLKLLVPYKIVLLKRSTSVCGADISITDALGLGDRLAGVIMYHVHPGEALSTDQVRTMTNLTTALGVKLNQPDTYIIGVDASTNATKLTSLKPGDVATVTNELQVCGAKVLVIDNVLLPADSVAGLPDPGPASPAPPALIPVPVAAPGAPAPAGDGTTAPADPNAVPEDGVADVTSVLQNATAGILDNGTAAGVGNFVQCIIQLSAAGTTLNTTTDSNGQFSFPGIPACAVDTGVISLPAGAQQLGTCIDSSSGLPPPYTFSNLLASALGNLTSATGTSPNATSINLSPLSTLLSSAALGMDGGSGNLGQVLANITQQVSTALGLDSSSSALLGDFVNGVATGSPDAVAAAVANAQTLISNVVGGQTLMGLFPGLGMDGAVGAINGAIASNITNLPNLGDPQVVGNILQTAYNALQSILSQGSSGSGGRKLLQTQQDPTAVLAAVSDPIAQLNQLARDGAVAANATSTANATAADAGASSVVSRCTRVAQYTVGPAAGDLAAGNIGLSEFTSSYSPQQIRSAVEMEQPYAPAPGAGTVLQAPPAPAPPASHGVSMRAGVAVTAGVLLLPFIV